jgi:hypothetical protein
VQLDILVIFVCSGLLVYWMTRVFLLLRASDQTIDRTLEDDSWRWRRIMAELRTLFLPPQNFVG